MRSIVSCALLAAIACGDAVAQPVYRCTAADGRVTFADRPCPSGAAQALDRPAPQRESNMGAEVERINAALRAERARMAEIQARGAVARAEVERRQAEQFASWPEPVRKMVAARQVGVGMTPQQVLAAWGEPARVNERVDATGRWEQWVYPRGDATQYVHMRNGVVFSAGN
jgi:hypothetical protein